METLPAGMEEKFLSELERTGVILKSAAIAGLTQGTLTYRRRASLGFEDRIQEALARHRESIEVEVHRRGILGWEEPVYQGGALVGHVTRYSDRLLELYAKRHIPEYRERMQVDASLVGGVLVVGAPPATSEEWERRHAKPLKPEPPALPPSTDGVTKG